MRFNLHSLYVYDQPLLVCCRDCQHRSSVSGELLGAYKGNMKPLADLKLVCSRCQSRDFECFVSPSEELTQAFLAGADLERYRPLQG